MKKLLTVLSLAFVFICSCIPLSASAMFSPIVDGVVVNPPSQEGYNYHWYFIFKDTSDTYHLHEFVSDEDIEPKIQVRNQMDGFTMWNSTGSNHARYTYYWDTTLANWKQNGNAYTGEAYTNITTGDLLADGFEIIVCDVDILDSSGNVFFLPSPYFPMTITAGEMVRAISMKSLWLTVVGNLGIVIPFGVGLLSLVIGLSLFGKLSKVFRI